MKTVTAQDIDALLPQTQCGLCGFGGCMPYANALAERKAEINLCPPGGVSVLKELGALLNVAAEPYFLEMKKIAKPSALAIIREDECIGCAKCIQACPVDAILGSGKNMHTVIASECTGCELCIAPCPVDCIDLITIPERTPTEVNQMADLARSRFNTRNKRLQNENSAEHTIRRERNPAEETVADKKSYIQEAVARAQKKKENSITLKDY